jgi:predicted DNA-binding transcriptional regulator AlpA
MPATTAPETPTESGEALPVLLGLREMVRLFDVAEFTVYRWNSKSGRPRQLPEPVRVISGCSLWTEEQIATFAAGKGLVLDPTALAEIRAEQGH